MRLILSLLLAGSIFYTANASTLAPSRSRPAIVQSLSTGIYRQATVIFEGNRAKIRFNRGGQMVLDLDTTVTAESEEIVAVDQNHNYWAIYVDDEAPEGRHQLLSARPAPTVPKNRPEPSGGLIAYMRPTDVHNPEIEPERDPLMLILNQEG